ncbi:hypothetical protein, partial [Acidithiobacillus sp.]|uniref:hypothetical protein n=1 Tax=Acidithiobacillus sp. TaxID=1872118 RepID=UPI003D01B88A
RTTRVVGRRPRTSKWRERAITLPPTPRWIVNAAMAAEIGLLQQVYLASVPRIRQGQYPQEAKKADREADP